MILYLVFVTLFTCYAVNIKVFASPLSTTSGVSTSSSSSSAVTEDLVTSTFKYDLMDMQLDSCEKVRPIFEPKNLTSVLPEYPVNGTGLAVCRSRTSCCTHQMEERLRLQVQKDFQSLLHHSSQTIQGLLVSTANDLQDHVTKLARESENKTLTLFSELYRRMSIPAQEHITRLYRSIVDYVQVGSPLPSAIPPEDTDRLAELVQQFFYDLFPLVYHQAVHLHWRDFTPEYKKCLRDASKAIQPFGSAPKEIGDALSKSMERTRTLLQALVLGGEVLNTTDRLMSSRWSSGSLDGCFQALLRLYYCPRCQGLGSNIKPCNGYCLNVVRGCLTQQRAQELDLPWNNFLIETERLARQLQTDNHQSLQTLSARLTDAVMYATMEGLQIETKVRKMCGLVKLVPETKVPPGVQLPTTGTSIILPGVTVSSLAPGHHSRSLDQESPLLGSFLQSLDSTQAKGFFANLAEALCSDESFAETRDTAECWNGQRVGEYTKTLVRPGVDAQKYNPELAWSETEPDPIIRQLSDKLRHIRQIVMGQLNQAQNLVSESYLRDEEVGSGSGQKPIDDDEEDQEWPHQGSGSGIIPSEETVHRKTHGKTDISTNVIDGQETVGDGQQPLPGNRSDSSRLLPTSILFTMTALATTALMSYLTSTLAYKYDRNIH